MVLLCRVLIFVFKVFNVLRLMVGVLGVGVLCRVFSLDCMVFICVCSFFVLLFGFGFGGGVVLIGVGVGLSVLKFGFVVWNLFGEVVFRLLGLELLENNSKRLFRVVIVVMFRVIVLVEGCDFWFCGFFLSVLRCFLSLVVLFIGICFVYFLDVNFVFVEFENLLIVDI